ATPQAVARWPWWTTMPNSAPSVATAARVARGWPVGTSDLTTHPRWRLCRRRTGPRSPAAAGLPRRTGRTPRSSARSRWPGRHSCDLARWIRPVRSRTPRQVRVATLPRGRTATTCDVGVTDGAAPLRPAGCDSPGSRHGHRRARGRAPCGRPVAPQCATRAGRPCCVHHHLAVGEGCHRWLSLLAPFSDQLQESVLESALWPHLLDCNACVYQCCHGVGAVSVAEFGTYG